MAEKLLQLLERHPAHDGPGHVPPDETRPGLGTIYDWFVDALNGSPYQDFALEIRARWPAAGRSSRRAKPGH